jgi:hypothetical protein
MRITEDGFELVVDSIQLTLRSEAFERNFDVTVRKPLINSSNSSKSKNHHSNQKAHKKSRRQAAAAKKNHHN